MSVKLYLRDKAYGGKVHEYGSNPHDSLYINKYGSLCYYNLQNGEGTGGDYEFCLEDGGKPKDGYIDVGGESTGRCEFCRWRDSPQKCVCCKRNPHPKDCYEKDKQAEEAWEREIFAWFDTEDEIDDEFL